MYASYLKFMAAEYPGVEPDTREEFNKSFYNHQTVSWPRPIPVSEQLPEVGQSVLWFSQGDWECGARDDATLEGKNWWRPESHFDICVIEDTCTHWLPMPPPVKD